MRTLDTLAAAALATLVGVVGTTTPAAADPPLRQTALGFCSLSSLASSTAITTCSNWSAASATVNYAVICAYVSGVVYRDDGVAPTATPGTGGQGISSGTCLPYSGPIQNLQFIQQAAGAILGISLYR